MAYKSSNSVGITGASLTVPAPVGVAKDDIVILQWVNGGSAGTPSTITWPSGFTEFADASTTTPTYSDGKTHKLAWKREGSSPPSTYTVSSSTSDACTLVVAAFSTASKTAIPIAKVTTVPTNISSPASVVANGVYLPANANIGWFITQIASGSGLGTFTAPSGFVMRETPHPSSNTWSTSAFATFDSAPQGDTGNITGTWAYPSGSTQTSVVLVAILSADVLFYDYFNRANESPIAGNWATAEGGGLQLISNAVGRPTAGVADTVSIVSSSTISFPPNQYAQVTINGTAGSTYDYPGIALRFSSTGGGTGYVVTYGDRGSNAQNQFYIWKVVNGTYTFLYNYYQTYVDGGILSATAVDVGSGVQICVFYNGVEITAPVDTSSVIRSGQPGLFYNFQNNGAYTLDNFFAGYASPFVSSATDVNITATVNVPNTTSGAMLLFISYVGTSATFAPTLNGVSLTPVPGAGTVGTSNVFFYVYYLLQNNLPSAGAYALNINMTNTGGIAKDTGWVFLDNVRQVAPTATSIADLTSPSSISIGSYSENSGTVAVGAVSSNTTTGYTTPNTWTKIWDEYGSSTGGRFAAAYRIYQSDGSDTLTFTPATTPSKAAGVVVTMPVPLWNKGKGINFRASANFAKDMANESYDIGIPYNSYSPSNVLLPKIIGSDLVSYGWYRGLNNGLQTRNRNSSNPVEFAGLAYAGNTTIDYWTLNLPTPGTYSVALSIGDASYASTNAWTVYDDTTQLDTFTGVSTGVNQYADATGVVRTSPADWLANNARRTYTFSSTKLRISLPTGFSAPSSNSGAITHLDITSLGLMYVDTETSAASNATSITFTHTVNNGYSRLLIVQATADSDTGGAGGIISATYAGISMTQILSYDGNNIIAWYLLNPPVGTANIVVTQNVARGMVVHGTSLFGVNQVTPISGASANYNATGITLNSTAGSLVFVQSGDANGRTTWTPSGAQTSYAYRGSSAESAAKGIAPGGSSVTMTWSNPGQNLPRNLGFSVNPAIVSTFRAQFMLMGVG